ncbi:predicted protein [Arabidopsis lyrata subsp. lyrata]|uniref:Predicted protein n=1 Tax=Arabidopsis lyrata subsp. lyrata TaxID=81972 RepID=D7L9C7_ARALL|nr:predicted protein [Arabidopsis lyrata subsp. lyrata]
MAWQDTRAQQLQHGSTAHGQARPKKIRHGNSRSGTVARCPARQFTNWQGSHDAARQLRRVPRRDMLVRRDKLVRCGAARYVSPARYVNSRGAANSGASGVAHPADRQALGNP